MKKCINCGREETENNAVTCPECGGELELTTPGEIENPEQETLVPVVDELASQNDALAPRDELPATAEEAAPKKKKVLLIVIAALVVIIIAGAAVGVWWYLNNKDNDVKNDEKTEEKTEVKEDKNKDEADSGMSEEEMQKMLEADENLVAVIDGVGVTKDDYRMMYQLGYESIAMYTSMYGEDWYDTEIDGEGKTYGEYLKEATIENLKAYVSYEKLAGEYGVKVDDKTIEDGVKEFKSYYGEDYAEKNNISEDALKLFVKRTKLTDQLSEKLTSEGGAAYVSDESVLPEFEKSYMRVQHILISSTPAEDGEESTSDEALEKAKEVIKKLDEGADFDSLIEEYNEDPGQKKGSYYTFTDGMMVAEFEEAAKALKVDAYTKEPVKTSYGYHIIKKYKLTTDCDEFKQIKQQKTQEKVSGIVNKKIDSVKFVSDDKAIDGIIKEMVETINTAIAEKQAEMEEESVEETIDETAEETETVSEETAETPSGETEETEKTEQAPAEDAEAGETADDTAANTETTADASKPEPETAEKSENAAPETEE